MLSLLESNYPKFCKILFRMPPEQAHKFSLQALQQLANLRTDFVLPSDPCHMMGLQFPNRLGLAAGFDKDAQYIDALGQLGFGFIEVGTVTPLPQPGNPQPRVFRLPKQAAILNRLGFNSQGMIQVAQNLKKPRKYQGLIGINIGKNQQTANEHAADDYCKCLHTLYEFADYLTINVSSPNTQNLRDLQAKESLLRLCNELAEARAKQPSPEKPMLLKISPDLHLEQIEQITEVTTQTGFAGIIATNTSINKESLPEQYKQQAGGVSGAPLTERSFELLTQLRSQVEKPACIISCGGIMDAPQATQRFEAGADLLQIYTGFIYSGPGLIKQIIKASTEQINNTSPGSSVDRANPS